MISKLKYSEFENFGNETHHGFQRICFSVNIIKDVSTEVAYLIIASSYFA